MSIKLFGVFHLVSCCACKRLLLLDYRTAVLFFQMGSESVFGLGAELDVYRVSVCFVGVVSFALLVRLATVQIEKRLEGPYLRMVYRVRLTIHHCELVLFNC
jgi:hypothetical protein